jgi:lipid A ethanolaminephosphotransferase
MTFREANGRAPRRPCVHVETLVLLVAAFLMLAENGPFWRMALAGRSWQEPGTWGFAAALFTGLTAFYLAFAAVFSSRLTVKPLLTVLLLVSAAASYYIDRYAVFFDRAMLANVLATNYKEASELLGWRLLVHLLVFGVVPALLVWWPALKRRTLVRAVAWRLGWIVAATAVGVGSVLMVFADFASLVRNHGEVRDLLTPGNVVAAAIGHVAGRVRRPDQPKTVVGPDARPGPGWQTRKRPTLLVVVIGETARAQNFSLNGYPRVTNPELARRGVINFPDTLACGTSTEVSLPCMFSPYGRRHYDEDLIATHESVLQVLARAGVKVFWRDNQSGCKGVCEGLPSQQVDHAGPGSLCAGGECLDELLLQGLDGLVRDTRGNMVVVLHQLGSHGPAYFRRYPPAFKRFVPACESEDLRLCKQDEIVNAYDNSLLYTDFVLGKVIDFLDQAQQTHDTAMLYISDHGESLGEKGLYLHGMPWAIAPDVQKKVPFVLWLSPAFQRDAGVDADCMRRRAQQPASQDNLFHSLLGAMDVQTSVYEPAMDVFSGCRRPVTATRTGP